VALAGGHSIAILHLLDDDDARARARTPSRLWLPAARRSVFVARSLYEGARRPLVGKSESDITGKENFFITFAERYTTVVT